MYSPLVGGSTKLSVSGRRDELPMIPQSYSYREAIASDLFRR